MHIITLVRESVRLDTLKVGDVFRFKNDTTQSSQSYIYLNHDGVKVEVLDLQNSHIELYKMDSKVLKAAYVELRVRY